MLIANHFFVRIGVPTYSNNQKNKFYSNYNNYINNNAYIYFSFIKEINNSIKLLSTN